MGLPPRLALSGTLNTRGFPLSPAASVSTLGDTWEAIEGPYVQLQPGVPKFRKKSYRDMPPRSPPPRSPPRSSQRNAIPSQSEG